jgi:hypothetical protein
MENYDDMVDYSPRARRIVALDGDSWQPHTPPIGPAGGGNTVGNAWRLFFSVLRVSGYYHGQDLEALSWLDGAAVLGSVVAD